MIIQVDFYKKATGKWYSGGEVDVGDLQLWDTAFKQTIVNNQKEMQDGWQGRYHVVTSSLPADELSPNFNGFYNALFTAENFKGLKEIEK